MQHKTKRGVTKTKEKVYDKMYKNFRIKGTDKEKCTVG